MKEAAYPQGNLDNPVPKSQMALPVEMEEDDQSHLDKLSQRDKVESLEEEIQGIHQANQNMNARIGHMEGVLQQIFTALQQQQVRRVVKDEQ